MKPNQHTPGPWEISRDAVPAGHTQVTVYAEKDGRRVATAFESEANAHLIAAAPDMLAALRDMIANYEDAQATKDSDGNEFSDIAAARAAIAKAEGKH